MTYRFRGPAGAGLSALVLTLAASLLAPSAAHAIDCGKAARALERMICADPRLRKADAAMGTAYTALLRSTDDPEIRTMLGAGQRRWLAARDEWLGDLKAERDPETSPKVIVRQAIEVRTGQLSARAKDDPGRPELIAAALRQRLFAARFTGGPFAGFATACYFLPVGLDRLYDCFGTRHVQNADRVCALTVDWASGHVSETRTVGRVIDGALRTIARCSIGDSPDEPCPDPDGTGGWMRPPADAKAEAAPAKGRPALDAEFALDADQEAWLTACLIDPAYPPADPKSPESTPPAPASRPAAKPE